MLYLLDANVLITAHNMYYPLSRVPEFWGWLVHVGAAGHVKIPLEIYEEISDGSDALAAWVGESDPRSALVLSEEVDAALVTRVITEGYAADLTDDEMEQVGRDPFLIAYALAAPDDRCVVTTEVSKPRRTRANRHIPDVCRTLGVRCIDSFQLMRALDFSTSWRAAT